MMTSMAAALFSLSSSWPAAIFTVGFAATLSILFRDAPGPELRGPYEFLARAGEWAALALGLYSTFGLLFDAVDAPATVSAVAVLLMGGQVVLDGGRRFATIPALGAGILNLGLSHGAGLPSTGGVIFGLGVLLSIVLTALFPRVRRFLPRASGPYKVGVVSAANCPALKEASAGSSPQVLLRIFYPAGQRQASHIASSLPLFRFPDVMFRNLFLLGAPDALKKYPLEFLLKEWALVRCEVMPGATLAEPLLGPGERFRVALLSHGNTAVSELYSSMAIELASHGMVVACIDHADGSAASVYDPHRGAHVPYDTRPYREMKTDLERIYFRREQIEKRIAESQAAADLLLHHIHEILPAPAAAAAAAGGTTTATTRHPIDLTRGFTLLGHSYGGATMLAHAVREGGKHDLRTTCEVTGTTLAMTRPGSIAACVVWDPAVNWLPDDVRDRVVGAGNAENDIKPGNIPVPEDEQPTGLVHVPSFFAYSSGWFDANWGSAQTQKDVISRNGGGSGAVFGPGTQFIVHRDSRHVNFSDHVLLMPRWLSQRINASGGVAPAVTTEVIHATTLHFLSETGVLLGLDESEEENRIARVAKGPNVVHRAEVGDPYMAGTTGPITLADLAGL